ncbi:MAG: H-type lectin domain-containing protein [Ignavibacteriales bacterium]|nr:H-type lectin domain-containing protein [Ignavibacteriales bacterium]
MRKLSFVLALSIMLLLTAATSNGQMKVQTGVWNADKTISNYTLAAGGEMERTLLLNVTFPKPFTVKPEISFSITRFDADTNINTRYDVKVSSAHKAGFTLEIKTWGGTKINLIGGTWMAIGE